MEACDPSAKLLKKVLYRCRGRKQGSLDLCVKRWLLIILIGIEDDVKVPMADEGASFEEVMSWLFCQLFDTFHQLRSHGRASELLGQLIIVDFLVIGGGGTVDPNIEAIFLLFLFHLFFCIFLFLLNSLHFLLFLLLLC